MSAPALHGKLITAAAKAALLPLGCKQVGRSRTWISDEGFWLIVIEFQPSGWSRGTYLNVGAMWLWTERNSLGFDDGYREGDFIPFDTPAQFTPEVQRHAARAAKRVLELRCRFESIADVKATLLAPMPKDDMRLYHAAIACGLAGEVERARDLFSRFEMWLYSFENRSDQMALGRELSTLLPDTSLFRLRVVELIATSRRRHGLTEDRERLIGQLSTTLRV